MFRLRINNMTANYRNQEEGLHNLDDTSLFADIVTALLGAIYVDRHRKAKFIQARILPTLDNDE